MTTNSLDILNARFSGWTESHPGGLICNPDARGAIIDQEILSGKWFVIFNANRDGLCGYESRETAVEAFIKSTRQ